MAEISRGLSGGMKNIRSVVVATLVVGFASACSKSSRSSGGDEASHPEASVSDARPGDRRDASSSLVDGSGVLAVHAWTWSPAAPPAAEKYRVESVVTLTAMKASLGAPSKQVHLATTRGARVEAKASSSTCHDLLAIGESRRCTFACEISKGDTPAQLEIDVDPERSVVVSLANPPPKSGACLVEAPCTPCVFPVSGAECQKEARAEGLAPSCSYSEDGGLGRRVTLYCPPG